MNLKISIYKQILAEVKVDTVFDKRNELVANFYFLFFIFIYY